MMSFKAEVIADSSGKWSSNQLRFATEAEARIYVADLTLRWMLVRDQRVVPSEDVVNTRIELIGDHTFKLIHLGQQP